MALVVVVVISFHSTQKFPLIFSQKFPLIFSQGHMNSQVHQGIIIKIIKVRKVTKPIVNRDENEMHDYVIISGRRKLLEGTAA